MSTSAPSPGVYSKLIEAVGCKIGKGGSLKPAPEVFHGVEFRSVRGKEVLVELRHLAEKRPGPFGPVGQETVPEDKSVGFDLTAKLVQKGPHMTGIEVRVWEKTEEKVYAISFRRHEQCRYGRNLLVGARSMRQNRRIPSRRPTLPDQGRHQQTAFVYEDDSGSEPCGFFLMRGHCSFIQRLISLSSRSLACRLGFWGVQPRECRSLLTW